LPRIRRLSEPVSNQIAAGEVVERPASVVKELVENAIDADASQVTVRVEAGGSQRIRVADDGIGMDAEDVRRCLERHATSKIEAVEDLERVATLGFRGEALPSIASVSRFSLTSRVRGAEGATRVVVRGGEVERVEDCGAPEGTQVDVDDLFFNVPARRKFLKRPSTEMGHVTEAVTRLALAWPRVHVQLRTGDRSVLDVPAEVQADPKARLARLLGRATAERLIAVPPDDRPHRLEVAGWVSEPGVNERTTRSLYVFLNGRFVRDRTVHHAILEAYRPFLERGRYPVVVLYLSLPPSDFDVNVHPQKTEVRFESPSAVHRGVVGALARTLAAQPMRPRPADHWARVAMPLAREPVADVARRPPVGPPAAYGRPERMPMFLPRLAPEAALDPVRDDARPASSESWTPLGLVGGRVWVARSEAGLALVDAAAVLEKARFQELVEARPSNPPQRLLVPIVVELDPRRAPRLLDGRDELASWGLEVEPFGPATLSVSALPAGLEEAEVRSLLEDFADEAATSASDLRRRRWARRLARSAGERVPTQTEVQAAWLERVAREPELRTSVDGRPTVVVLDQAGLDRLFRRHG
jgi:DNA mismatch repair protein MutL